MQSASVFRPSFSPFNHLITVAATLRRKQNPNHHHHHHQQQQSPLKSNLHQQITAKVEDPSSLRGSDVLTALQRAATLKKKKKQQQKKQKTARGKDGGESENEEFDYDNVRPIIVRSDWKERIDELETRVQELKSQYHY